MKKSTDLYLLQDGTHAAAGDVSRGKDGVLRHKNGLTVALYADGSPQTVERDAEANMNVEAAKIGESPVLANEQPAEPVKAEDKDDGA